MISNDTLVWFCSTDINYSNNFLEFLNIIYVTTQIQIYDQLLWTILENENLRNILLDNINIVGDSNKIDSNKLKSRKREKLIKNG